MKMVRGTDLIPPKMVEFLESLTSLDEVEDFLKRRYPKCHIRKGNLRVSVSPKTDLRKNLVLITTEHSAKLREDQLN